MQQILQEIRRAVRKVVTPYTWDGLVDELLHVRINEPQYISAVDSALILISELQRRKLPVPSTRYTPDFRISLQWHDANTGNWKGSVDVTGRNDNGEFRTPTVRYRFCWSELRKGVEV